MNYIWKSFDYKGKGTELLELLDALPYAFFLDSSLHDPHRGRYSFIGADPFKIFSCSGADVLDRLKKEYGNFAGSNFSEFSSELTPFTSGLAGCLSYDFGLYQEKIHRRSINDLDVPDCCFGFYDCILTIDHFTQKLIITSCGLPEKDRFLREKRAKQRLEEFITIIEPCLDGKLKADDELLRHFPDPNLNFKCNYSKSQYIKAVQNALEYISSGDIYQVNLSQRFELDLKERDFNALSLYKTLCSYSPSPFGGFINCGDFQLISNSPERFLRLKDGIVQTRPMKGTRARGDNKSQDEILRQEILNSKKDKAELLMITDLLRNDLGKVCDYGSVHVREMRTLEEYNYVFQATSTIEGILNKDNDCFDLIRAVFPGGSITGCPKIRAMEIIEELEPNRRGMYTGSLGYINFNGNMDMNILIRTVCADQNKLYFQVGGGIVADSDPEEEYEETLIKARSIKTCLESRLLGRNPAGR